MNYYIIEENVGKLILRFKSSWGRVTLGSSPQNLIDAEARGALNYAFWGAFNS